MIKAIEPIDNWRLVVHSWNKITPANALVTNWAPVEIGIAFETPIDFIAWNCWFWPKLQNNPEIKPTIQSFHVQLAIKCPQLHSVIIIANNKAPQVIPSVCWLAVPPNFPLINPILPHANAGIKAINIVKIPSF